MIQTMRENLIIKMNKLQQHHLEELKDFYKRRYKEHKSWRYSLRFDKDLTWADNLEVILGSARIDYPNNIKRLSSTDESDVFNLSNNSTLPDVTC